MATLKEFEDLLREAGMTTALAILDGLRKRDRDTRAVAPARRVAGKKMTAELAKSILDLHATTEMTQQEIAFKLGVNQGRVNEVVKRGKWLNADPASVEARSRDKALERLGQRARARRADPVVKTAAAPVLQVAPPAASALFATSPISSAAPTAPNPPAIAAVTRSPPKRSVVAKKSAVSGKPKSEDLFRPKRADAETVKRRAEARIPKPRIISAQLAFLDL